MGIRGVHGATPLLSCAKRDVQRFHWLTENETADSAQPRNRSTVTRPRVKITDRINGEGLGSEASAMGLAGTYGARWITRVPWSMDSLS